MSISYSEKYNDDEYEYRHVNVPRSMIPGRKITKLYTEKEWRSIGIQQSLGWEHYAIFELETNLFLFRRKLSKD